MRNKKCIFEFISNVKVLHNAHPTNTAELWNEKSNRFQTLPINPMPMLYIYANELVK